MKYMVVVNQKYIVSVEANSALSAEHEILDYVYYGVIGAQAFDRKSMNTDCFEAFMNTCETVSLSELFDKANAYKKAMEAREEEILKQNEMKKKIEEMKREIELLERNIKTSKDNEALESLKMRTAWN